MQRCSKSKTIEQFPNGSRVSLAIVNFPYCSARAIVDRVVLSRHLGDNYKINSEMETPGRCWMFSKLVIKSLLISFWCCCYQLLLFQHINNSSSRSSRTFFFISSSKKCQILTVPLQYARAYIRTRR